MGSPSYSMGPWTSVLEAGVSAGKGFVMFCSFVGFCKFVGVFTRKEPAVAKASQEQIAPAIGIQEAPTGIL